MSEERQDGEREWVLVPREPTEAMIHEGGDCPQMQTITGMMSYVQARGAKVEGLGATWDTSPLAEAYRAMLSASPTPPQASGAEALVLVAAIEWGAARQEFIDATIHDVRRDASSGARLDRLARAEQALSAALASHRQGGG